MTVFWLGLALLTDGLNSIVLPVQLIRMGGAQSPATTLGLVTFAGLLAALVIQPMAGEWSDRLRGTWGRTGAVAVALFGILAGLFALGLGQNLLSLFVAYLVIQVAASIGRAGISGFIPDMLPYDKTGQGDGLQEGMRTAGSALGFLVLGSFLAAAALGSALMLIGAVLTAAFCSRCCWWASDPARRDSGTARPPGMTCIGSTSERTGAMRGWYSRGACSWSGCSR